MPTQFLVPDYRITWLRTFADSTANALNQLRSFSKVQPWFDGLFVLEQSEYFLGPLAVAAHTYCVGTIADFKRSFPKSKLSKCTKPDFYRLYPSFEGRPSPIELLCSISNLFKHQDEWDAWPTNYTTKVLAQFGIGAKTAFPIHEGFSKLDLWDDLGGRLQSLLGDWAAILSVEAEQSGPPNAGCANAPPASVT
jgi:hypothetical protein